MAAHNYIPGLGAYSVSKAALESFVKVLGEQEREHGITMHLFECHFQSQSTRRTRPYGAYE